MILRAAIVFLLMLNLGVAAWWLGGASLRAASATPAINESQPGLRLVNEPVAVAAKPDADPADANPADATPAVATPAVAASPSVTPAPTATDIAEKPASPAMPVVATTFCLSFGPFDDAAARDAARPKLQALAQRLVAREAQTRSGRGWRVYMPPLESREEAQAVIEKIKATGIKDWYIIANGSEANGIALGRYGSEDSARRREAELAAKGFIARAESLGDSPSQWWLDARFPSDASRVTLAAVAPSRALDCARLP